MANFGINELLRQAVVNGRQVRVSPLEYKAYRLLFNNRAKLVTKDSLASCLYGDNAVYNGVSNEMVEKVVSRLRRKLRAAGAGDALETRRGFGYVLNVGGAIDIDVVSATVRDIIDVVSGMSDDMQAVALAQVRALANLTNGERHG